MPKPDVEKFMTDPEFQGDREFFNGIFDKFLEKKMADEAAKKAATENVSVFDKWFGGAGDQNAK